MLLVPSSPRASAYLCLDTHFVCHTSALSALLFNIVPESMLNFVTFFSDLRTCSEQVQAQGLMPQLDELLAQLSAMHDMQLPPGYNPDLKFMSHLWGEAHACC
jgi:hypothetical protein